MKEFFRSIHLYLSLAAGLVIAIVCLTGAILVFEKEMQVFFYPERYYVEAGAQRTTLTQALTALQQTAPDARISSVKVYADPERTVEVAYKKEDPAKNKSATDKPADGKAREGKGGPGKGGKEGGMGNQAFVHPYTAQIIGTQSQRSPFFFSVFSLHRWLLAGDTGKLIVGISTSFFLFILLTGIILWWPQNKKILKQRLTMKWNAGWKRLNHDWHIVLGFYTAIFLFAFAFTGLAWSFQWFNDAIYWVTSSENKRPEPPKSLVQEGVTPVSADMVYKQATALLPGGEYYTISFPQETDASYSVTVMPADAIHERATHQLFFDQYSGTQNGKLLYQERSLGQRVRTTFYPVHVGSIAGLPGRIIAFICCLAGFTFPITGVILWINRLNKKNKRQKTNPGIPLQKTASAHQ